MLFQYDRNDYETNRTPERWPKISERLGGWSTERIVEQLTKQSAAARRLDSIYDRDPLVDSFVERDPTPEQFQAVFAKRPCELIRQSIRRERIAMHRDALRAILKGRLNSGPWAPCGMGPSEERVFRLLGYTRQVNVADDVYALFQKGIGEAAVYLAFQGKPIHLEVLRTGSWPATIAAQKDWCWKTMEERLRDPEAFAERLRLGRRIDSDLK
ncbi:MAG: hypothetical protein IT315_11445 [Anaerolineales bacterium]|nr:hypothetical protein [Anaerolineales bacterium]